MEFTQNPYTVYVKTNSSGYITSVASSAFLADTRGWIEIDHGYGERYGYARNDYFLKPIYTKNGAYRYKLVDGKPVECPPEEIAAQEEASKPVPEATTDDVLNALLGVNLYE